MSAFTTKFRELNILYTVRVKLKATLCILVDQTCIYRNVNKPTHVCLTLYIFDTDTKKKNHDK